MSNKLDTSTMHMYFYAVVDAPSNGITKKQAACLADVAINYGLGFMGGSFSSSTLGS